MAQPADLRENYKECTRTKAAPDRPCGKLRQLLPLFFLSGRDDYYTIPRVMEPTEQLTEHRPG